MNLLCPTCGAEVSFRFDDSFVRVCAHCKSAVARTDRGAESLGQFADPVRMNSLLRLFSDGWWGPQSFILVGMAQLQHAAGGLWQEWYAKLGGGVWGWLTEAQGRLYMTFERADVQAPAWDQLYPNASMTIDGREFVVSERATATYVSGMGEIPYRLVPQTEFYFVDLSDGAGGFATIDYNDGSETPTVYVGQQVALEQLKITGGEAGPRTSAAQGGALKCPDCGGALELRTPDATLSVACPYCGDLIDVSHGQLSILAQQGRRPVAFDLPLGSEGTLPEGKFTVIGYVARSARIDGSSYPFEEYLLHSPTIGYRWLQNSDNHWSYVQPIASGAVEMTHMRPKYDGVKFRPFQHAQLRVDYVVGELYWKVEIGETVDVDDYIAPPATLSREYDDDEQNWSLSTYMTQKQVEQAFGIKPSSGSPIGIAPNQPYPGHVGKVITFFSVALFAVGIGKCMRSTEVIKHSQTITIPSGPAPQPTATPIPNPTEPPSAHDGPPSEAHNAPAPAPAPSGTTEPTEPIGHISFSKPFALEDKNIEIDTSAGVANNWAYLAIDLVNDKTGVFVSFDQSLESYSGFEDGESWSEGSSTGSEVLAPLGAGDYVLRIEAQQGSSYPASATIQVKQGVFRARWLFIALGILFIPYGLVLWHASSFKKRRMEDSNMS